MELTTRDFIPVLCQATLFTPDEDVSSARLLRGPLLAKWGELFDEEPTVLPSIDGIPEVPRLTLQSKSLVWRCEIAPARINLYWYRVKAKLPEIGLQEFCDTASKRLAEFAE